MPLYRLLYILFLLLPGMQEKLVAQVSSLPATPATVQIAEKEDSSRSRTIFNLLSFTGTSSNGQNVLSWKTDSRSHFTGFIIERSANEKEFAPVGNVELSGVSKTNSFTYADNKPLAGRNFYRLVMADSGGRSSYSTIISLTHSPTGTLQVHFDSQSGTVGLTGIETGGQYPLKVYNCNGQLMLQKTITTVAASIPISQLPHGLYVVYAVDGNGATVSQKIIW